jgi:hypothetical protein
MAPLGVWSAKAVDTSNGWVQTGSDVANPGSFVDYAVLSVYPDRAGQELESVTGAAQPFFDVPASQVTSVSLLGYPAAAPYNGNSMYSCASAVHQLADASLQGGTGTNPMWAVTCSMTQGSSGGGWFATVNGRTYLISDTSLGDSAVSLMLGPYFAGPSGHNAQALYQEAEQRFLPGGAAAGPVSGRQGNTSTDAPSASPPVGS